MGSFAGATAQAKKAVLQRMKKLDSFLKTKPCMSRFLDPPMIIAQDTVAAVPAGLAGSINTIPACHGVVPHPDAVAANGTSWAGVYQAVNPAAGMATITGLRARHPDPVGGGGAVGGCAPLR